MIGLEEARLSRLITLLRTVAELLDNATDGLNSGVLIATVLLLVVIALHAMADALETCPDALTVCRARFERS
ncbi:hypothetical protein ACIBIZ_18785 [Nonomuraea spiralis]|uniref:hypothetical protein n=1 Tax=Nonomuraea TaxID=83681 RepID=UPI0037B481E4